MANSLQSTVKRPPVDCPIAQARRMRERAPSIACARLI